MYGNYQPHGASFGIYGGYMGGYPMYMLGLGSSSALVPTFLSSDFSELITKIKDGSIGSKLVLDKRIDQQNFVEIVKALCSSHCMVTSFVYLHQSNGIISEDIQEAVPFLKDNVCLTSIQIPHTEIHANNIKYWLEILHTNIFMTKIALPISNSIDRALRARLDAYLQRNNLISLEIEQSNHYIAAIIVARAGHIPDIVTKNIILEYCNVHVDVAEARLINQVVYSRAFQYVNALEDFWKESNIDKFKMFSTIANDYLPGLQKMIDLESFNVFYTNEGAELIHIHIDQLTDQLKPIDHKGEEQTEPKSTPLLFSTKEDRIALAKQFRDYSNDSVSASNCFPSCCIL